MTLKDRVFTGVLALCSFLAFYPQYVSSKIIAWIDMMFYFLPFRMLPAELLHNGILPLWNPYIYCGQPLLANMQSAVLYPPDMLFYVLPTAIAVKTITFLAFFIMSFSMYKFLRLYKVSEEGSLLGAFLFSFTYYMTIKAVELADLHSMVWMPAVLYFVKKYAMRGKLNDLFFISITLALSFLGGHAQVFLNVYLLFAAYYFFETVTSGRKGYIKAFAALNGVLALIVLAQALPTAEFILHSKRMAPEGMGFEASTGGFMKLEQLAEMFLPFIVPFLPKTSAFINWMGLVDTGILALLLAALGAAKSGDKKYRLFLISVFTFSFFVSFMGSLPFYRAIWENSAFLRMIRYPAKINLLFFFSMCVLAAEGFDLLFKLEAEKLKGFIKLTLATGAAVLLLYVMLELLQNPILAFYKNNFAPGIKIEEFIDKALIYDSFVKSLFWYVLVVFAAVFAVYLAAAKGIKNAAMKYTVLVLAVVISVSYNRGSSAMYAGVDKMTAGSPAIDFLLADRDFKDKRVLAPGIINQLDHDVKTNDVDALVFFKRDCLNPNVPMYHGIANVDGFDSLILGDFFLLKSALNALDEPWEHPAFSLLNVKYISSSPELYGKHLRKRFKSMNNLYEYINPSGPAYFVPLSTGWPAENENEKIGKAKLPLTSCGFMEKQPEIGVVFKRLNINAFTVSAVAPEAGTLVIAENFFPGWNAYENGKRLRVFKANVCFMAVDLGAGSHSITFKYEPVVFFISIFISLIALVLLAAAGMLLIQK